MLRQYVTKWRLVAAAAVLVVLAVVLSFGPLVRSRANATAERYGATLEIGSVSPGWDGVTLREVKVTFEDAPGIRVELDEVQASWGTPRTVVLTGGRARLSGEPRDLADQVEKIRARRPKSEGESEGGGTQVTLERFDVHYDGPAGKLLLKSVKFERDGTKLVVRAEAGEGDSAAARGTFAGARLEVDRKDGGVQLIALDTDAIDLTADLGAAPGVAVPSLSEGGGQEGRLLRVRKALARAGELFDQYVSADGKVELRGVRAQISRGTERLSIGPATFKVGRKDGRVTGEYVAGSSEDKAESLTIVVAVPREGEPLAVDMRGGPVSFASLGLKEGEFHLVDVDRATLRANARFEVDPQGEVLSFDGEAQVQGLSAALPQIAKDPIRGMNGSFRGSVRAALDGSKISVKNGELELGRVRLSTSLDATLEPADKPNSPPRLRLDASYDVPLVPCQALLDAAPQGLLPTLAGMRLAGSLALKGTAKFDTAKLDKDFNVAWDLSSTCRVTDAPPAINVARFQKPFKRTVYSPKGERTLEIETGPGTGSWTRYSGMSKYMELAVISFEDGRFRRHEGFDQEAIRNSIRENLRKWQFVRGASTISMQLAKNLYLERDKRLSRKIEEAFLTMYLEQALTKEQMIELYLNVVEFGPNIYGIKEAAHYYFKTSPAGLSLSQAFYLGSILPAPHKEHFGAGGALSSGWLKFLRTVMKHAHKLNRISEEELERGLAEIPVRNSPGPMRDPDAEPPSPTDDTPPEAQPEAP